MSPSQTPREEVTFNTSAPDPTRCSLRIVLEDRVLTHELPERGEVVLGRGHDVDVFIDHRSVSRSHVRLRIEPSSISVVDLESANGTRLSGRRLAPATPVPLRVGEALELGDVVVVLQRGYVPTHVPRPPDDVALGGSAAMRQVEQVIDRIAPGMISVLISGETGAGKEVVAEAIHRRSRRTNKPFVRLNCAAVAEHLLESEWFGHERGSFTGANAAKPGLLETADGGTVLLDEVGELAMDLQAKLLRVLEERTVMRVGAVRARRIDVRFLAATNHDLEADVSKGTFRQDLFFRLNGVTIHVPPLRERREEIEPLARRFAFEAQIRAERAQLPVLRPEALALLEGYAWPGNVRELKNVMERAVLLAPGDAITVNELPKHIRDPAGEPAHAPAGEGSLRKAVADVERLRVIDALAQANGNQKRAAEILGISRGSLLARIKSFGIPRPRKGRP
jgi:transcriptional regulator with PAS, ATPase and Fis domain